MIVVEYSLVYHKNVTLCTAFLSLKVAYFQHMFVTSICVKHTENIIFLRPKYFFDAASFVSVDMKYFFVLHQFFYCWHEILFRATSTRFCWNNITFCASQTVYFNTKLFSMLHQIFVLDIQVLHYALSSCWSSS